jgi:hypothetical protein
MDEPPGKRINSELIIALTAVFISIVTLVVSIYQAQIVELFHVYVESQEEYQKLSRTFKPLSLYKNAHPHSSLCLPTLKPRTLV